VHVLFYGALAVATGYVFVGWRRIAGLALANVLMTSIGAAAKVNGYEAELDAIPDLHIGSVYH